MSVAIEYPASEIYVFGVAMRSDNILNTSASLLGVALLIVTGLHITDRAAQSISDEVDSALHSSSSAARYRLIWRIGKSSTRYDTIAANVFFLALITFAVRCSRPLVLSIAFNSLMSVFHPKLPQRFRSIAGRRCNTAVGKEWPRAEAYFSTA